MSRLLVLGCSQRKAPNQQPIPAIDRYDGPAFRVLKRYLRSAPMERLHIFILSAEFGLIPAHHRIPLYDRKMTIARAGELASHVKHELLSIVDSYQPTEVFICAGKTYLRAVLPLPVSTQITMAPGGQGKKLTALKRWLTGESSDGTN